MNRSTASSRSVHSPLHAGNDPALSSGAGLGRRLRVAIVEDSDNIRERLVQLVEDDQQMQVVGEATTEARAVAMCRAVEPDAIILDLKLADGTGIGVLRTLRYTAAAQKPTIIVLTNFPRPAFERAARELGADWFLDKTG